MTLEILYRGPLSGCNYGCQYCPFAKRTDSRQALAHDAACLDRFTDWVELRRDTVGVLFTPWGEALIRPAYQAALARLSHMPNVRRAAIQTNLSCKLDFVERCDTQTLALWCTYHPEWVERQAFLDKAWRLHEMGARFSVGVVGFARFGQEILALREALPQSVYLWINAVKRELHSLSEADRALFESVDPLYPTNTRHHPSKGRSCRAGVTSISVDGEGNARRCHFIPAPIGNIYAPDFDECLRERGCVNETCHCHIGYVHLDHLRLAEVFGEGLLERIPEGDWRQASAPE
jgi:hypothetical protein